MHSIERSAQEDTLLVLFNTAISNLVYPFHHRFTIGFMYSFKVLFRNNFALSRDITGLFQSFQSSSTVLDPAANPSLFRSMLVIIIKVRMLDGFVCTSLLKEVQDVVESDKSEIVRE